MNSSTILRISIYTDLVDDIDTLSGDIEDALDDECIDWEYDSDYRLMIPADQYEDAKIVFDRFGVDYDIITEY